MDGIRRLSDIRYQEAETSDQRPAARKQAWDLE